MTVTAHYAERSEIRDGADGAGARALDLARLPVLGRLLRWRWARLTLQIPVFLLSALLILHGLFGPDIAPHNLATLVTWIHYRGLLVLVLLLAGNFFCLACPFLLPRELARILFRPVWNWPRLLRNKWLAVILFVAILFAYEWLVLWETPRWTAWLIAGYFASALVVDALFKHASFCKWLCPIGQFNFVASAMSPLEVKVRDHGVCTSCRTKECIRGSTPQPTQGLQTNGRVELPLIPAAAAGGSQRGCELALFQPLKVGNMDCTFCLDCVHACPHDNIGVIARLPGSELWAETARSGVGLPLERKDLSALVIVFTFGALLNAFGMISPVYALQEWLGINAGLTHRTSFLALLFVAGLIIEPVVLLGLASSAMWWVVPSKNGQVTPAGGRAAPLTAWVTALARAIPRVATRYSYSLAPLGFGVWLAHYSFHFLTGILLIVPVTQKAVINLGIPLEESSLQRIGMNPGSVFVLEMGMMTLGMIGSWIVAIRLARADHPLAPWRAYLPWAVLHVVLWAAAVWLMVQPMEMRVVTLGG